MPFNSDIKIVAKALEQFHKDSISRSKPVINQQGLEQIITELNLGFFAREGGLSGKALELFLAKYFDYVTRLHHPHYLGHQCAPPYYSSALGTLINGFANNVSSIFEMAPASASIEHFIINWMLEKVGWEKAVLGRFTENDLSPHGGGILVNGGSIANLTALVMARSRAFPEIWKEGNPSNLAILLPAQSHYSLTKAAGILGIGANSVYFLEVDDNGKVRPEKITNTLKRTIDNGQIPIALAANACSTSVGLYDPLDELGDFCNENGIWFHVDGAHGASALLSEKHKRLLKGVEKADSLVWDAHKLLQTPSLCAALLVRNHNYLDNGFKLYQDASYIFHEKDQPGFDSIQHTIETTKSGLGEQLFFVMGAIGEKGLSDYLDHKYQLTLEAHEYISNCPDFECPVFPESNILCFRVAGDDKLQLDIRNRLTVERKFYITTVIFKAKRYLRLVFMSPNTTLNTVKELVQEISRLKKIVCSNVPSQTR
ncbi:MAG: pyridoxal phosphate-dependent decarboxylase family protein [Aurantibacter sp.]